MAGIVTLGNRAYERINKVLGLFGVETVNDIDLGTAFPVHDLTPIVQSSQAGMWLYNVESTVVGAGSTTPVLRPWDASDWDVIQQPDGDVSTTLTDADLPNLTDDDIYVVHAAVASDGSVSNSRFFLRTAISTSATYYYALTQDLESALEAVGGLDIMVGDNHPYYASPMPLKMLWNVDPMVRITFGGAGTAAIFLHVLAAPKGVLPLK